VGATGDTVMFSSEIVRSGKSGPGALTGFEKNNCPAINPLSTIIAITKIDNVLFIISPTYFNFIQVPINR